jgi:hypothetical protein
LAGPQLIDDRTIVGTNATVFPASFCCREKARISSFLVMTGMVTCCCPDMVAADDPADFVPEAGCTGMAQLMQKYFKYLMSMQKSKRGLQTRVSEFLFLFRSGCCCCSYRTRRERRQR